MKIKGQEFLLWLQTGWPTPAEDWYWDGEGPDEKDIDPNDTYNTDDFAVTMYQGSDEDPTEGEGYDCAILIRKWHKTRDFEVLTIMVPKIHFDEVKTKLKAMKVKIVK